VDTSLQNRRGSRSAVLGLLVNPILVVVKRVAGFVGHSYALIADEIGSTDDIFSALIVQRGHKFTSRKPAELHPLGNGKAESIAAAAVALRLFAPRPPEIA